MEAQREAMSWVALESDGRRLSVMVSLEVTQAIQGVWTSRFQKTLVVELSVVGAAVFSLRKGE